MINITSSQEITTREQNKENLIKEFLESNDENTENICNFKFVHKNHEIFCSVITAKIIEKDFPNKFQSDFPLVQDQEKLKSLNPEIFSIEELLFKQYQSIKVFIRKRNFMFILGFS